MLPLAERFRRGDCRRRHQHVGRAAGDLGDGDRSHDGARAAHAQRRPARRRAAGDRRLGREHSGAAPAGRAAGARGAACCTSDTNCTRASTSATGWRSTRRGWRRRAGAASRSSWRRFRSRPTPCGWPTSTGRSPIEHALGDGEDFELLLAAPPEAAEQIVQDQPIGVADHADRFVRRDSLACGKIGDDAASR